MLNEAKDRSMIRARCVLRVNEGAAAVMDDARAACAWRCLRLRRRARPRGRAARARGRAAARARRRGGASGRHVS
jgi:hypothetical protein